MLTLEGFFFLKAMDKKHWEFFFFVCRLFFLSSRCHKGFFVALCACNSLNHFKSKLLLHSPKPENMKPLQMHVHNKRMWAIGCHADTDTDHHLLSTWFVLRPLMISGSDGQHSGITHNACKDDEGMSRRQLGKFFAMRQPEASLDLPPQLT